MRTTWIHLVISGSGRRSVAQELMVMNSKRIFHLHVSRSILCQENQPLLCKHLFWYFGNKFDLHDEFSEWA
jgi:heme/copper-type cytochrome/quinol oxidase subunit 1